MYSGIVTEFASGGDLQDYVKEKNAGKGLSVTEAREIGLGIAAAIKELHSNDIVHRDLKPRNILSSDSKWKIADFGISKNLSRLVTQKTFQSYGTAGYAAPEQFQGVEAKPSADRQLRSDDVTASTKKITELQAVSWSSRHLCA